MFGLDVKPELESLVYCPECDETLEIVSLHPLRLAWAYDDEGEYDYYNDVDDDLDDLLSKFWDEFEL